MKLLNQSLKYLSISMVFVISIGLAIFYFNMLTEIKESLDEGLEHYKRQIIYKIQLDSTILEQSNFDAGFFAIREISEEQALVHKEVCIDTLMYMQDNDDAEMELEPVRMLTTAFENKGHYYELRIINSMVEEDDLMEGLLLQAIWMFLALILSVFVINKYVLQRLWKPFYNLLHQLEDFRLGSSKKLPTSETKIKEFVDLQNTLNTLLQHSMKTYEQQKQFIGNASHELQTPLAIAINKMELLIENENLETTQAESIVEVMDIVERLVRLNKSLLLLTKIENKQFFDNQNISLNNVVKQSVSDLEEIAEFKNVKVSIVEIAELSVEMDVSLASIVVSNLIRNAIFQNVPDGEVTITISKNVFQISNTGKNRSLDPSKIFTRFYRSEVEQTGTGLGLAIVKAICELYEFTISYRYENAKHCFELNFTPQKEK